MTILSLDIETFSSNDLKKGGVYKYVEAPDFGILLLCQSVNRGPERVTDLFSGEKLSDEFFSMLLDPQVLKTSHNANFERVCLSKYFGITLPPEQWECTMAKSTLLGLPLSLEAVATALAIDEQKDSAGKALIKYFCLPCKPTKVNGHRTRNLPHHAPEKWEAFKKYCAQDVRVEKAIRSKLHAFQITETEKKVWALDQKINDRGVRVDPKLIANAIDFDRRYGSRLNAEAVVLTDLENPNSVAQLKRWIEEQTGEFIESLNKGVLAELTDKTEDETVKRILQIRQEMAKTSVKKYEAMIKAICADDYIRGLLQYNGANRTGRWAGRLVQVQNLPQNHIEFLDLARRILIEGNLDLFEIMFGNVPDTLSQLIRTAFIPSPGCRLLPADFSAIEARVIAWLAGEKWRLDVFNTHGKIYEASAAQMFKIPIEKVTKGSDYRAKGKIAELALGYQGGPNALINMGALKMGIAEEELPKLVNMWRNANKKIVQLWADVEACAWAAVQDGMAQNLRHGIRFFVEKNILFIELPSKRRLAYLRPRIGVSRQGGMALTYEGMEQTRKIWTRQDTYGGKLVENIVQAIARDILADAMLRLDAAGYEIAMHVHDEVVLDVPEGIGSTEEVNAIMGQPIAWAKGLPLKAESFETYYYKKD